MCASANLVDGGAVPGWDVWPSNPAKPTTYVGGKLNIIVTHAAWLAQNIKTFPVAVGDKFMLFIYGLDTDVTDFTPVLWKYGPNTERAFTKKADGIYEVTSTFASPSANIWLKSPASRAVVNQSYVKFYGMKVEKIPR